MMGSWDGSGISWTICKQSAPRTRQTTTTTPHRSIFRLMSPQNVSKSEIYSTQSKTPQNIPASNTFLHYKKIFNYSTSDRAVEYNDEHVCLSVCPRAYLQNYMFNLHQVCLHMAMVCSFCGGVAKTVCISSFTDDVNVCT